MKKLTPLPIRFLIDTEVHPDHTTGHYLFSPPAVIINSEGAGEAMRKAEDPERLNKLMKDSPEMREAAQGYRLITPQIEYGDKMTLRVGERTFELIHLRNVHSEADTAIWLPKERVLFAASVVTGNNLINMRPFVTVPDILKAIKTMKALNAEIVIPGHGMGGTGNFFDASEHYYEVLLERVGQMVREGKSLEEIKQKLRMPEVDNWANSKRLLPIHIEAAYRAVKAGG